MTDRVTDELISDAALVGGWLAGFGELAPIAVNVGTGFPTDAAIDTATTFVTALDLPQVLGDLDAVVAAHRLLAAVDHDGPAVLAASWQGCAGAAAADAVDAHDSRSSADLGALSALAAVAAPALAGLKAILGQVFTALAAVADPVLAGHPVATVNAALTAGMLRPGAVADEIAARVRLFDAATAGGRAGVHDILAELVGATASPAAADTSGELILAGDR